jgi:hypothetical protein
MLEWTVEPIPPIGGVEVVATYDIAYLAVIYFSVAIDGPPVEDFVRAITQSACKLTLA